MVSRISGPIPSHPSGDDHSQTYLKVPVTTLQRDATQGQGALCMALEVEGHSMPSAYKHTSLFLASLWLLFCDV